MRIPPDHLMSEAVIQGVFFHQCQIIGLNCTLEVSSPTGRHDVIIFDEPWERAMAIVECKRKEGRGRRQIERYGLTGVPVHVLFCVHNAESLARQIASAEFKGVLWKDILEMPRKEWRSRRSRRRFSEMNLCDEVNFRPHT